MSGIRPVPMLTWRDRPSADEIRRVREYECVTNGHDFEIIQVVQENDPKAIVCSRCGKSWAVAT